MFVCAQGSRTKLQKILHAETDFDMGTDSEPLRVFPFDSRRVDLFYCVSSETNLETRKDFDLDFNYVPDEGNSGNLGQRFVQMDWACPSSFGEFMIQGVTYGIAEHGSLGVMDTTYQDIVLSIHIVRDYTFYLYKGALPMYVAISFGFLQYELPLDEFANRLSLVVTVLLTSFAIQWTVTDRLPRTPHLTAFDRSVFACLASLVLMAVGSVWASRAADENVDRACLVATLGFLSLSHVCIAIHVRRNIQKHGGSRKWADGDGFANGLAKMVDGSLWHIDCTAQEDDDAPDYSYNAGPIGKRSTLAVVDA